MTMIRGRHRSKFRLQGPLTRLDERTQLMLAYIRVKDADQAAFHARRAAHEGIEELRHAGLWPLCSACLADDAVTVDGLCAACEHKRDNYSGPWEVASGDSSREAYDRAAEQKRALR